MLDTLNSADRQMEKAKGVCTPRSMGHHHQMSIRDLWADHGAANYGQSSYLSTTTKHHRLLPHRWQHKLD
jgi:hypothetical protein